MMKPRIIAKIRGPVLIIGFGSIGRGLLPLLFRHIDFNHRNLMIIDPNRKAFNLIKKQKIKFSDQAITPKNYKKILQSYFADKEQGFCINLSVDVSSLEMMRTCREMGALYIDTVVEPWVGFYDNPNMSNAERTNFHLRNTIIEEKRRNPGGSTAVSCCGANPGMVSWFVKQALVNLAHDLERSKKSKIIFEEPSNKNEWAQLMKRLQVKGIHIAERDTQISKLVRPIGHFWNTWSVEGFISEGLQPAELGWGSHEKWLPANAKKFADPMAPSIYLEQPGAATRVRTWCPTLKEQFGLLVTHNEAISLSHYFSIYEKNTLKYRPTCHYAYRPCDDAWLSLDDMFARPGYHPSPNKQQYILESKVITEGIDELGVLLYGHEKNAYWYGSQLTHKETLKLVPDQNATGLQVTSAVLAGIVWALENPNVGIVEVEEMDYRRCLDIQEEYLGNVQGYYTDWHPLKNRPYLFPEDIDADDPWQFRNVLIHQ